MREINILFSQKEIEQRIAELAKQIERDYEEKEITVPATGGISVDL